MAGKYEEAPNGDAGKGAKIFKTKCSQCHSVAAGAHKQVGISHPIEHFCLRSSCAFRYDACLLLLGSSIHLVTFIFFFFLLYASL